MVPPVPQGLRDWVSLRSRDAAVWIQREYVPHAEWNAALDGVRGGPLVVRDEGGGEGSLSRRDVHALAADVVDDHTATAALRLLWHAAAWGAAPRGNVAGLVRAVAHDHEAPFVLRDAAWASRTDARVAFDLLRPQENAISGLGPGLFTKFLYFAGAGVPNHPCLIVNPTVLEALHEHTYLADLRPRAQFEVDTYLLAVEVMTIWAAELSTPERYVAPDEVERWAYAA